MAINIGRLGYVGLGIEDTPGSAVAPDVFFPFTDVSLRGHHEPIEEIASKTARVMDRDSVSGKQWSEGDLTMNLDVVNSGYLFKMALGQESLVTGTPNTHTFYTTMSGNTPTTATLVFGRTTDIEEYSFATINELSLEVSDSLATVTASIMANFPEIGDSQSVTITSGTVFAFHNYEVRFGNDLTAANGASPTPMNEFSITIANNAEGIYQSGQQTPTKYRTKGLRVSGSYTLFFENETDKNAYYALNKRAMEIKFTGNADEELILRVPKFRLSEGEVSTGVDDFFVINCEFVAEDKVDTTTATRFFDVVLKNDKSTVY